MIDTSDQRDGIFRIQCDSCDTEERFDCRDFQEFIKEAKDAGWTMRKDPADNYTHYCESCSKPSNRLRLAAAHAELRKAAAEVVEIMDPKNQEPATGCGTALIHKIAGRMANLGRAVNECNSIIEGKPGL